MSRFVFIALLAVIATTSAKPHVLPYSTGYYSGYVSPSYYDYPYYSYPYTPVTYVETVPITTVINTPTPVAAVPFVPAKYVARNAPQVEGAPEPPNPEQELPQGPPPAPPAPPAGPPQGTRVIIIKKKAFPDPAKLLSALPISQLLDLPPVKQLVALKTSKLETIMGLKGALQGALQAKLAPIAALLP